MFNPYYKYKKPLEAKGGIRSRVIRGRAYQYNWWSRRWMQILEESIDAGRLTRGRSYARKGQVVEIDVEPGLVSASVQGTRKKPYQIKLGFETVTDEAKELLLLRFRERASFAAKLLAQEMPEEMEDVFRETGIPLFLKKSAIRRFKCTCPDDAIPCKHIVAVLLLLAEVIDDDPFLLLKLRGIDRERLINLLTSESAECSDADEIAAFDDSDDWRDDEGLGEISGGTEAEISTIDEDKEETALDESWYSSHFPSFAANSEPHQKAAALDVMNDFPFWRGEQPFRTALAPIYERAKNKGLEILTGEKKNSVGRPKKLF
ncbi:MAG: SWIM zinc finger family protein [Synergistaceae bacterium]